MSVIIEDMPDDYLEHYGVQGMKWGIRKQPSKAAVAKANSTKKSGASLVAEKMGDKVKASAESAKAKAAEASARKKQIAAENKLVKQAQKDPSKLTNEELQRVSQRSNLVTKAKSDAEATNTYNTSKRAAKKAAKNSDKLSDAELNYRNTRQQKEKQLKENTTKNYKKEHKVAEAIGQTTLNVATNAVSGGMKYGINSVLKSVGLSALGSAMTGIKEQEKTKKKGDYTYEDVQDIINQVNSRNLSGLTQKDLEIAKEYGDNLNDVYNKTTDKIDTVKTTKGSHAGTKDSDGNVIPTEEVEADRKASKAKHAKK